MLLLPDSEAMTRIDLAHSFAAVEAKDSLLAATSTPKTSSPLSTLECCDDPNQLEEKCSDDDEEEEGEEKEEEEDDDDIADDGTECKVSLLGERLFSMVETVLQGVTGGECFRMRKLVCKDCSGSGAWSICS